MKDEESQDIRADQETDNPIVGYREPLPHSRKVGFWPRIKQSWKKTSAWNKLLVLLTAVIAVSNILYTVYARKQFGAMNGQLEEIRKSGTDTHDLAIQAKSQADRTQTLADRMKDQADETSRLADSAGASAKTAKNTMVLASRAWIAPSDAYITSDLNKSVPLEVAIEYRNVGRSPALNVHPVFKFDKVPVSKFDDNTVNDFISATDVCRDVGPRTGRRWIFLGSSDPYKLMFTIRAKDWVDDDFVAGNQALMARLCFAYNTIGEVHHTSFCYYYIPGRSPSNKQMQICPVGTKAD